MRKIIQKLKNLGEKNLLLMVPKTRTKEIPVDLSIYLTVHFLNNKQEKKVTCM